MFVSRPLLLVGGLILSTSSIAQAASDSSEAAAKPKLATTENCETTADRPCGHDCKTPTHLCGPRVRVIIPPPQVVFRKSAAQASTSVTSNHAKCAEKQCGTTTFGHTPSGPTMTTIHVPYTYMVPVPTYSVLPFSNSFGSAPVFGFGNLSASGFTGIGQIGSIGQFGGVQPAVAMSGGNQTNESLAKAISALVAKKEAGYGSTADGSEDCKKEIAALNAKIEAMRSELTEFYRQHKENDAKVKEAIIKLSEKLVIINDKLGETKNSKTLAATIAELDARITKLKSKNGLQE